MFEIVYLCITTRVYYTGIFYIIILLFKIVLYYRFIFIFFTFFIFITVDQVRIVTYISAQHFHVHNNPCLKKNTKESLPPRITASAVIH